MIQCVKKCCEAVLECNVAFLFNNSCFHIKCVSAELCYPVKPPKKNSTIATQMVLVNPIAETSEEILGRQGKKGK